MAMSQVLGYGLYSSGHSSDKRKKKKKITPTKLEPNPITDLPKRNRNCSTCSWPKSTGRCPFFGELKDGGDLTVADNGCSRHNFAVRGDEW